MDKQVLDELERLEKAATRAGNKCGCGKESDPHEMCGWCLARDAYATAMYTHAPALLAAARDAERFRTNLVYIRDHMAVPGSVIDYCNAALERDGGGA